MAVLTDEQNESCALHLGTSAALGTTMGLENPGSDGLGLPQWTKTIKNIREQYDLDRDMRGHVGTRIWGLACYRGVMAVLVTRHPTNMIQYKVASDERAVVGFAIEDSDQTPDPNLLFAPNPDQSIQPAANGKKKAIHFLLSQCDKADELNQEDQRLIYAAACCSIVDETFTSAHNLTQRALKCLSTKSGADLSEEISKCTNKPSVVASKSLDQFDQPGSYLFEKCDICDAGIPWASSTEAQCDSGHLFSKRSIPKGLSMLKLTFLKRAVDLHSRQFKNLAYPNTALLARRSSLTKNWWHVYAKSHQVRSL